MNGFYPLLIIFLLGLSSLFSTLVFGESPQDYDPAVMLKKGLEAQAKEPIQALDYYRKAYFSRYPNQEVINRLKSGYRVVIQSLIEKKEWDRAEKMVDEALSFPIAGIENFYAFKMQIASDRGDHNLAILYANQLASLTSPGDQTHFFKGKSYYYLKSYKLAIESLRNISDGFPGIRAAKVWIGDSYFHRRELEQARTYLQQAQSLKQTEDVEKLLKKIETDLALEADFISSDISSYFSISVHKDKISEVEERLGPMLEGIYVDLTQSLHFFPEIPIRVIVYQSGNRSWTSNLKNPNWAAGAYDGEIRIPGKELDTDDYELETLLRHEMTHLFLDALTRNTIPTWMNEGLAQYFEKPFLYEGEGAFSTREEAPLTPRQRDVTTQAITSKKLLTMEELEGSFNKFNRDKAELAYAQAHLMVRFFMETQGSWKLIRMLREIFMGSPFEAAFEAQCGLSSEEFYLTWQVRQKDRWKLP